MELSEFVSQTLSEVFKGIEDFIGNRDKDLKRDSGICEVQRIDRFGNEFISFDISVTSSESKEKEGGIGIKVVDFFNTEGNVSKSNTTLNANRIQFKVPVKYPTDAEYKSLGGWSV